MNFTGSFSLPRNFGFGRIQRDSFLVANPLRNLFLTKEMHYNRSSSDVNYTSSDANRSQHGSQIRLGWSISKAWNSIKSSVTPVADKAKNDVTNVADKTATDAAKDATTSWNDTTSTVNDVGTDLNKIPGNNSGGNSELNDAASDASDIDDDLSDGSSDYND